jgi:hypothetical protein
MASGMLASEASTKQRFALSLRNAPSPMATFPSFKLAWDNALNMFQDANATICGCHYAPAIGCEPAHAEFMVATAGRVEEYTIHQTEA